jgi:hypothetical protein
MGTVGSTSPRPEMPDADPTTDAGASHGTQRLTGDQPQCEIPEARGRASSLPPSKAAHSGAGDNSEAPNVHF